MAGNIKVMIVEDNLQLAESIADYFENKSDIKVISIANNGLAAIEQLRIEIPDTIILDLVMPQADGFVLLNHLRSAQMEKKPQVIVLSAMSNEIILKRVCELGAVYFIAKPFSMSILAERIKELAGSQPIKLQSEQAKLSSDERIATILLSIGFRSHLRGYRYSLEGLKMLVNKPAMINNMTKQLYPRIGEVFNTTGSNVERSIRTVIQSAHKSGKLEGINALCGYDVYTKDYKITSNEILSVVLNSILVQQN